MSEYVVTDSQLEDVADAIRAKSGGSSPLAFPAGFVSEIGSISTGGGGDQTISFLDWVQKGCDYNGHFTLSQTRIACFHILYKCKSISIPSDVELALASATMPKPSTDVQATNSSFVGFWNGTSYGSSFTWFNTSTINLTNLVDRDNNYVFMFLRYPDNSTIPANKGNSVEVTYNFADGAIIY